MADMSPSHYDTFPRIDINYCYICNAQIYTPRTAGDKEEYHVRMKDYCREHFLEPDHLDITPLLCSNSSCAKVYQNLPMTRYVEERVPFRTEVAFDGGSFPDFAIRNNRPEVSNQDFNSTPKINIGYGGRNAHLLEPLFQAWLFFGLCQQSLGPQFIADDYIEQDASGKRFVTLAPLDDAITDWMLAVPRTGSDSEQIFARSNLALGVVIQLLGQTTQSSFDNDLRVFIASAAELISRAVTAMFPGHDVVGGFGACWPPSRVNRLVNAGWCPYEAYTFTRRVVVLAGLSFYSNLIRHQAMEFTHSNCTENECQQSKAVLETPMKAPHRLDCKYQECEPISVDEKMMSDICLMLLRDQFPVLRLHTDDLGNITSFEVVPYEHEVKYIAISHVWAQGMGNAYDNCLNKCYLTKLFDATCRLTRTLHPEKEHEPLLIWIDTLCCPVMRRCGDHVHNKALELMRAVYTNATAVLVMDTELELIDLTSSSPLEVAARTLVATWTWRLWTLQEGAIPLELWFLYKNRVLNSNALFLAARDHLRGKSIRNRSCALLLLSAYLGIRILNNRYRPGNRQQEFALLLQGIEKRRVTKPEDEPLCIATLLRLDLSRILAHKSSTDRMLELWNLLSEGNFLLRSVAFQVLRTFDNPGRSWAFSTFLQNGAAEGFMRQSDMKAVACKQGLLIPGAGVAINPCYPRGGDDLERDYLDRAEDEGFDLVFVELRRGHWGFLFGTEDFVVQARGDKIKSRPKLRKILQQPEKNFVLLQKHLSKDPGSADNNIYLLIETRGEDGGRTLCKRHRLVQLVTLDPLQSQARSWAVLQATDMEQRNVFNRESAPLEFEVDLQETFSHGISEHLNFDQSLRSRLPSASMEGLVNGNGNGQVQVHDLFPIFLKQVLSGYCAVAGQRYPENHLWCLE